MRGLAPRAASIPLWEVHCSQFHPTNNTITIGYHDTPICLEHQLMRGYLELPFNTASIDPSLQNWFPLLSTSHTSRSPLSISRDVNINVTTQYQIRQENHRHHNGHSSRSSAAYCHHPIQHSQSRKKELNRDLRRTGRYRPSDGTEAPPEDLHNSDR